MDRKRQKLTREKNDIQKEGQDAKTEALEKKLVHMENKLELVTAELQQVKEEWAHHKIHFETENCELKSKIDKCTELQSENERLQIYLEDLEPAKINVEETSQRNFFNIDLTQEVTQFTPELEQVKEERTRDKINFEAEKCEMESKIVKYKEQCIELQNENGRLQNENKSLQNENDRLQKENKSLQKYLQDLQSANINVEEKSKINLCNSGLSSHITKIINNRYTQTPSMNHAPGVQRNYSHRPTPMAISNLLYASGAGFAPNMSASTYPSTAFTSSNRSNSSHPASSLPYLLSANNPYPVSTSPYPANFNNHYPASTSHYPTNSNSFYPASTSALPTSSNSRYSTSCTSSSPAPTSTQPYSSNRHYPASNLSYSVPSAMNQPSGASSDPSMGSKDYVSKFRPSVKKSIEDALDINSLPDEIVLKVFGYLMQNQLCRIARVCRRWSVLAKSPPLWKKVHAKIPPYYPIRSNIDKSLFIRLPSCVTSIRLDFAEDCRRESNFVKLCEKLHQKCPHLKELILNDSKLSSSLPLVIDLCIQFLLDVKNLVFHSCIFPSYSARREYAGSSKIEVLDLSHSLFGLFDTPSYLKMPYLKQLRLSNTNVDDSWFEDDISFLNQLHVLDVGYTHISSRMFSVIRDNGLNLRELFLCNIHVLDRNLNFNMSVFPHLKTICLRGCHVTCEGVVSLIQSCQSLQNVYADEGVTALYVAHPLIIANRCKLEIVKFIPDCDDHQRGAY